MTKTSGRWKPWLAAATVALGVGVILVLGQERMTLPEELTDDTVVATLGSSSLPYPPELRTSAARVREAPEDREAALDAARRYLDYGRSIGDARFAGAALGVLQPWVEKSPTPDVLNLAASARQYMHDFNGAIDLLDAALQIEPGDAQALLSRANIYIVQGRFGPASDDCRGLAQAQRVDLAILCDTTAKALTDQAPQAYERLLGLTTSNALDPALRGYAWSLLAEIARFQLWPEKARTAFENAVAEDPGDLRTLMIFADFELGQGRAREALALLKDAPPTDSIMVRQAVAHKALQDVGEVARLSGILRARFEAAAAVGEAAHAREAARYWLDVEQDTAQALAAAKTNWTEQRELEDALLLLAAANAAGMPAEAGEVREWARAEGVAAPMYLAASTSGASE